MPTIGVQHGEHKKYLIYLCTFVRFYDIMISTKGGAHMATGFFSVAYQDGYVFLSKGHYYAGSFAVHLLNDFYKKDLAARLSVFKSSGWQVLDLLNKGCMTSAPLINAGTELQQISKVLPGLKPFSLLDVAAERERIAQLFTQETATILRDYFLQRSLIGQAEEIQVILRNLPEHDEHLLKSGMQLMEDIRQTITMYHIISDNMRYCFDGLCTFISRLENAERYDEAHLLPLALDIFRHKAFPLETEYISVRRTKRSEPLVARKLIFGSYASFLLTDFFEGLHHCHYPKRCEICGKYFLMQSSRYQRYCGGWSGIVEEGRRLSCRQYAVRISQKELAEADPRKVIYNRRCSCIRSEQSRGTITAEFAATAKALAKRCLNKAIMDPGESRRTGIPQCPGQNA